MPRTATILCHQYRILESPDRLWDAGGARVQALHDPEQRLIWIDPYVPAGERGQLIADAICRAWDYHLQSAPLVD